MCATSSIVTDSRRAALPASTARAARSNSRSPASRACRPGTPHHTSCPAAVAQKVAGKFNLWLGREQRAGRAYTDEQLVWLRAIRDHLAVNAEVTVRELQDVAAFGDKGGIVRARTLFGGRLNEILDDLSDALVA